MKRPAVLRLAAGFLTLLLVACAGLSAGHLPRNPVRDEAPQRLEMRYVAFQYQARQDSGVLRVEGEAYPDVTRLPDWASWYGEIFVAVYLVDSEGRVLASHEEVLPARQLDREAGFPVAAEFELGTAAQQPLSLTFGYRLSLTDGQPGSGAEQRRTFVTEGALEK